MDEQPAANRTSDVTLETIVFIGFFGTLWGLAFFTIPEGNESSFNQLTGALILAFGLVAKSLWDRRGQSAVITQQALANAQNSVPSDSVPSAPAVERAVERGAAQGTEEGVNKALEPQPDPEEAVRRAIQDAIDNGVLGDRPRADPRPAGKEIME